MPFELRVFTTEDPPDELGFRTPLSWNDRLERLISIRRTLLSYPRLSARQHDILRQPIHIASEFSSVTGRPYMSIVGPPAALQHIEDVLAGLALANAIDPVAFVHAKPSTIDKRLYFSRGFIGPEYRQKKTNWV